MTAHEVRQLVLDLAAAEARWARSLRSGSTVAIEQAEEAMVATERAIRRAGRRMLAGERGRSRMDDWPAQARHDNAELALRLANEEDGA